MNLTIDVELTENEKATLEESGYVPVVWWQKQNVFCTTGEALKNIEIGEKQKTCKHIRGSFDSCRYCGKIMPWR